ncbi:MAG: 4Fe-4S binding protein [Proteobacteria bacterium]|nr:4Fe-4S binding protein [Pseudomonadota bacterium]MBU1583640.1 4Fe-4S binding protein [Pseudomonadota bacterium]MBU2453808.1 4Fe-4S binding protein [Pseudomonadota bacterium]MBU2629433.1 4Fe-4S binding protein [Pseudomonadota bacterium]
MNSVFNHRNCSGCGICKLACSIENFRQVGPSKALLRIQGLFPAPGHYQIHFCDQCGECAKVCPVDAFELDNGIYRINEDECIACHECVEACPKSVMIIKKEDDMPTKCILCGECAKACPRGAIMISRKENAKECR